MPIRLENTWSGVVVEYTLPEEIAPAKATYAHKNARAAAEREAGRRKRLLDTLRNSKRWRVTDKPVRSHSDRQVQHSTEAKQAREIEARLRLEYEQKLENELARRLSGEKPTVEEEKAEGPSAAQVRAWAKDNGVDVPAKGKLPEAVVSAYKQAQAEAEG